MASGTINLGSNNSKLAGRIVWSSSSNGSSANSSQVTGTFKVRRTDGYTTKGTWTGSMNIGGRVESFSHASTSIGSSWVTMISFTITREHYNDGSGECYLDGTCHAPSGTALAGATVTGSQIVTLDKIPRYASISESLNSTGLNTIKMNWSSDSNCDLVQYSLNGANWVNTSGNPYTISGLNPNTTYRVKTRVRRRDSQLYSQTGDISATTKDIARITGANNFKHGNSTNVSITNPSGASLSLTMKIGNTTILSKSVLTGNNGVGFNDSQLDTIYKLYGGNSVLTVTFILTTAGAYTNSRTCTIALKGNQKTIKEKIGDSWRRGKAWIKVGNTWRRGVVWIKVNGTWRRGI